jgi:hypothetical protein
MALAISAAPVQPHRQLQLHNGIDFTSRITLCGKAADCAKLRSSALINYFMFIVNF